jgi:hypothetical protein
MDEMKKSFDFNEITLIFDEMSRHGRIFKRPFVRVMGLNSSEKRCEMSEFSSPSVMILSDRSLRGKH